MRELVIENGVVIDDADAVLEGIQNLSGKMISGVETIKKFITNEKSTRFYIDKKCSCKMQPDRDTVYLWLDSGYTDYCGDPIMISLLNTRGEYRGHYAGSFHMLANSIRDYFPQHSRDINNNLDALRRKYDRKIASRRMKHIDDETEYLVSLNNIEAGFGALQYALNGIDIEFDLPEADEPESIEENIGAVEEPYNEMTSLQKEITIGLLLDKIDSMQIYIDELLSEIEKFNSEDKVRMAALEEKNKEYKTALVQMRTFMQNETLNEWGTEKEESRGHVLLGRNSRILILGDTALDHNTMNGIAKLYGFEKKDLEYVTDYTKVVSFAGRINNSDRYAAIIFGACPHKVQGLGDWSSLIEKCRNNDDLPYACDARNKAGGLKVTKESFKKALWSVCNELKMRKAG